MASLFDKLIGYQGNHPKDVAEAYASLREEMRRQEEQTKDQQLTERFEQARLMGLSPASTIDPVTGAGIPQGMNPLERWQTQIDSLIQSENPVLQKQGLDMIASYQQRATAPPSKGEAPSTAAKMAAELGYRPGTKSWNDFINRYAFKSSMLDRPKRVSPAEAKNLAWIDGRDKRNAPIVGRTYEEIEGQVFVPDDAEDMRNQASGIIDALENSLFNPKTGIYMDPVWQNTGAPGVIAGGIAGAIKDITQADPDYKAYSDTRAGSAANIIRAMGEKGALSDKDIERALALLPNISGLRGLPDLPETAQQKFKLLKTMLRIDPSQWGPLLDMAEAGGLLNPQQAPKKLDEDTPGEEWER